MLTKSTTFIIGPVAEVLGLLMNGIFWVLDKIGIPNIGLSIIFFTIIIYMALMPLTVKQQKFSKLQSKMTPEINKIQAKYKNKKDQDSMMKQNEEMQAVYKKYGVSASGSCVQLIIQMPILFALFTLLRNLPQYFNDGTFSFFNILPDLTTTPSASFADGFMVALPALVCLILFAVLTLIPQLYMSRNQTGQQAQSMRMMAVVMTVMMLWMGWSLPVGVLLYYDVSSAWQVIQQIFVTQKVIDKAKADEEERLKNAPLQVEVTRREKKPRPHKKK